MRSAFFLFVTLSTWAADTPPGYALATAHPLATQAGMEILDAGGNAFDAAVAISAALAVVEPASSGIGGGGFWLLHRESDGFETLVDGRETAPQAAHRDLYLDTRGVADPGRSRDGARAAAIPGAPAAWVHIARKYGTKPLPVLLAPALRFAQDGFVVDARLAQHASTSQNRLSPAAAAVFRPGGRPVLEHARLRQPDLAATLDRLAQQGREGFYAGPVAEKLVRGARAAGGLWTLDDLRRYRVLERKPLTAYFRDYRLVLAPPPSAGGVALAQTLAMLEAWAWPPADPVRAKHLVVEALRLAFRDRAQHLGDPDFVRIPLYRLLSPEYILALARGIRPDTATPSAVFMHAGEGDNTTHFSVLDAAGNRVAATLSINLPFGSGFMPPGTGVLLNNEMDDFAAAPGVLNAYGLVGSAANAIAPDKRPLSSMSPTFVEGPRGLLILGTPGGSRIVSLVLLGVLGFTQGFDPQPLVSAPRYHHQYLPDRIEFEPAALSTMEQEALRAMGHALEPTSTPYGNMQAVWWDQNGDGLQAASDPRGIGTARVQVMRPAPATVPTPVQTGR
ncbi:MAG: gamma-glutamyltransferase [Nevskiales bacterium]|nr:gamma-glutamyltransferase [Nevskiales bacterium]